MIALEGRSSATELPPQARCPAHTGRAALIQVQPVATCSSQIYLLKNFFIQPIPLSCARHPRLGGVQQPRSPFEPLPPLLPLPPFRACVSVAAVRATTRGRRRFPPTAIGTGMRFHACVYFLGCKVGRFVHMLLLPRPTQCEPKGRRGAVVPGIPMLGAASGGVPSCGHLPPS
jgi:hypothetical protein